MYPFLHILTFWQMNKYMTVAYMDRLKFKAQFIIEHKQKYKHAFRHTCYM